MWSPTEVFCGLFPSCTNCGASFDVKHFAPITLSCAHTFCQACLNRNRQKHKRRCFSCEKRYSSYKINSSIVETIKRMKERRDWLEQRSYRCDECDVRRPQNALRRCISCEDQISIHVPIEFKLNCAICLECCVTKHNGHELVSCGGAESTSDSIVSHCNSISEPTSPDPRDPLASHQTTFSSWNGERFFNSQTFPFGSHRVPFPDSKPVYFNINRFSSEGVVCEESPVYSVNIQ
ncbi:unnamed protein product [Auanema sp. JU1783]|nr:unnamed protein product [Auanema sp. JU1783]